MPWLYTEATWGGNRQDLGLSRSQGVTLKGLYKPLDHCKYKSHFTSLAVRASERLEAHLSCAFTLRYILFSHTLSKNKVSEEDSRTQHPDRKELTMNFFRQYFLR